MTVTAENTEKLQRAISFIQEHSNQTIAKTLKYAAQNVLRYLSAASRIRIAKKRPPSKSLKKVKGSEVLQRVNFKHARPIFPNASYYIFVTDYEEVKQNFAWRIFPKQPVQKKTLLDRFTRKRAGLARDTMRYGLKATGASGGSYQSLASKFVSVDFHGDFDRPPKTGDNTFSITVEDNLSYILAAFKSPNALDQAIGTASKQMIQKFLHSHSELAQKFNADFN